MKKQLLKHTYDIEGKKTVYPAAGWLFPIDGDLFEVRLDGREARHLGPHYAESQEGWTLEAMFKHNEDLSALIRHFMRYDMQIGERVTLIVNNKTFEVRTPNIDRIAMYEICAKQVMATKKKEPYVRLVFKIGTLKFESVDDHNVNPPDYIMALSGYTFMQFVRRL